MTIEQLVKVLEGSQYQGNGAEKKKIEMIRKHLKVEYVEYGAKLDFCKQILLKSMYTIVNGREVFKPNSPLKYALIISTYLQAYFDFEQSNLFMEDFNLLEKNNVTELLIKAIGDDVIRFNTVLNMMTDDLNYENSLVPYIDTKIEAMDISLGALRNALETKDKNE